ncbi:hypothetical protein EJB05_47898, partial [Eragrostis curvula]
FFPFSNLSWELRFSPSKATPHRNKLHSRPLTSWPPTLLSTQLFHSTVPVCARSSLPRVRSAPSLLPCSPKREKERGRAGGREREREATGRDTISRLLLIVGCGGAVLRQPWGECSEEEEDNNRFPLGLLSSTGRVRKEERNRQAPGITGFVQVNVL